MVQWCPIELYSLASGPEQDYYAGAPWFLIRQKLVLYGVFLRSFCYAYEILLQYVLYN